MFCRQCGKQMDPAARFCPLCGAVRKDTAASTSFGAASRPGTQLLRSRSRRMIAGVCGGFADHYGWDLNLVRIVTVVITLVTGVTLFAYIAAWIIIPDGQYALPFGAPPPPVPPASSATASAASSEGPAI